MLNSTYIFISIYLFFLLLLTFFLFFFVAYILNYKNCCVLRTNALNMGQQLFWLCDMLLHFTKYTPM